MAGVAASGDLGGVEDTGRRPSSRPSASPTAAPLLEVEGLTVSFPARDRLFAVVRDFSFAIGRGELVGLVGESGSGKSMTALAVMRLIPAPGRITSGRILLEGEDLLSLSEPAMRRVRGARVGMVFQEPMTALNPVFTVGFQIVEAIRVHRKISKRAAKAEAVHLLEQVSMPDPGRRLDEYPHQLSGGQRQRAMIAMALACGPDLLLADEPTTALDVTIQAQMLELLEQLRQQLGLAVLLITHDLAVVAETCERVVVMYAGEMAEEAGVRTLFEEPAHPYTRGLLAALPKLGRPAPRGQVPSIPGQVPDLARLPSGCSFHPRCSEATESCRAEKPQLTRVAERHRVRCLLYSGPDAPEEPS